MARPSIFSKEYKRRMKARRRRIGITMVVVLIICGTVLFGGFANGWFNNKISFVKINKNDGKSLLKGNDANNAEIQKNTEVSDKTPAVVVPTPTPTPIEKYFEVLLYEGKTIKVIYEDGTGGKKIKAIKDDVQLNSNISPSGKNIVVWEAATQNMYWVDAEGVVKNITKPSYVTRNSATTYTKESQMKRKPEYIWCSLPKFISEDAVVYVSNLPMLNETGQYIWIYEKSKDAHNQISSQTAKSIVFKDIVEGKLTGEADGVIFNITPEGKLENKK